MKLARIMMTGVLAGASGLAFAAEEIKVSNSPDVPAAEKKDATGETGKDIAIKTRNAVHRAGTKVGHKIDKNLEKAKKSKTVDDKETEGKENTTVN